MGLARGLGIPECPTSALSRHIYSQEAIRDGNSPGTPVLPGLKFHQVPRLRAMQFLLLAEWVSCSIPQSSW